MLKFFFGVTGSLIFKGAPSVFRYLLLNYAICKSFSFSACRAEILFCMMGWLSRELNCKGKFSDALVVIQ